MPGFLISVLLMHLLVVPSWAQVFTDDERDLLVALLPGSEQISQTAEDLITSATEISRASDRITASQSCAMDRALIGLGAALQNASAGLKRMEPLLLNQTSPGIGTLLNPTPAEKAAWQKFFQRQQDFRSALDPLGSAGPPMEAGPLIKNAGKSLVDLDEQSGIGLHLDFAGSAIEAFRLAALAFDKTGCARLARLIGHTVEMTGSSLRFSSGIVWQSGAAIAVAASLLDMLQQAATPVLGPLDRALDLYAKSLLQQSQALRRQSAIALQLDSAPEWSSLVAKYRSAAPVIVQRAALLELLAARLGDVRNLLTGPLAGQKSIASAMRSGGAVLESATPWFNLQAAGQGLASAGEYLANGQTKAASQVLRGTAVQISSAEKSLVLAKP